jgi:glutathione S-transferase
MAIKLFDLAGADDDRRFSPYCWRVKMALKHKGLDFETLPWRFTEKEAIAPYKSTTVPVLIDGDQSVYDSWAIALYLDEVYPSRPRLFGSTESRTLCDFFNQWTVKALHPHLMRIIILELFDKVHPKDKAYFRESREKRYGMSLEEFGKDPKGATAAFRGALEPLRPVLVQNPFICGNGPGYADYILFGTFQWPRCVSPARLLEPDDPIYAWRERLLQMFDGYAWKAKGYPVWA